MSAFSARTLEVRHLQIARAALAAVAAVMVTFSSDHSAAVGMSTFSGFALLTGLAFLIAFWLVYPTGRRWPAMLLALSGIGLGMTSSIGQLRTITGFFAIVIAWALITGLVETIASWRELRRARHPEPRQRKQIAPGVVDSRLEFVPGPLSESRDGIVIGVLTLILGLALLVVPARYALPYTIAEAHQTFLLTGITIGVGIFGGYAVIVAVYLGIAGFSPSKPLPISTGAPADADADQKDPA
jgi:hypothetical protein